MRSQTTFAIDCLIAAVLSAAILASLGIAHGAATWYPTYFKADEREQHYGFHDEVPQGTGFRNRVEDGAQEWNGLDTTLKFRQGGVNVSWAWNASCQGPGKNSIHWRNLDALALATRCVYTANPDRISEFRIAFDESRDWHVGTGPPGSSEFDTWSVSAHEFGHAGGFGSGGPPNVHWDGGGALCPSAPNDHTMCPTNTRGTQSQRSLEEHDRHTFRDRY